MTPLHFAALLLALQPLPSNPPPTAPSIAPSIAPPTAPSTASSNSSSSAPQRLDVAGEAARQVVVDREAGQYLGHVSTVLLRDGRTVLAAYPKGHGKGPIVMKRSGDGGRTWSERLPTPASFATSLEVPTLHRVVDAADRERLLLWSGLHPARRALSA